jgi:hypothetical protein
MTWYATASPMTVPGEIVPRQHSRRTARNAAAAKATAIMDTATSAFP